MVIQTMNVQRAMEAKRALVHPSSVRLENVTDSAVGTLDVQLDLEKHMSTAGVRESRGQQKVDS
jgi:hypothetical protein